MDSIATRPAAADTGCYRCRSWYGNIAASAAEGTARQPEATSDIRTTMIIAAALIEGVALFGEVICVLLALK